MAPRGRSRFFSNTVALVLQTTLATLITLVQVKILANHLSQSDFGLFASLRGLSLLLSMIAANGIPQLLVRYLPIHEAGGDGAGATRMGVFAFLAGGGLAVLLCAAAHLFREAVFAFGGPAMGEGVHLWFYATTVGVTLKMVLYGGLTGARRLAEQTVVEVLSLGATLVWIWIVRDSLTVALLFKILGVIQLTSVVVALPIFFGLFARSRGGGTVAIARSSYGSYWLWSVGLSFVALAFTDVDRYLLAHVLALEALALFHIASRVTRLAHRVLGIANLSMQPEISRLEAESRHDSIESVTAIFLKFNALVSVVVAVGVGVFAQEIIIVVASRDYLPATTLLVLLAAALPVTTMTAPLTTAMKATDQVRSALWVDLTWAGVYVVLMFTLGRSFGLAGVAIAYLAAGIAQFVAALTLSRLAIDGAFVARLSFKMATAACAFAPAVVLTLWGTHTWVATAARAGAFAAGGLLFFVITRRTGVFSDYERVAIADILRTRGLQRLARLYS